MKKFSFDFLNINFIFNVINFNIKRDILPFNKILVIQSH
jgi:hypothetical protein